MCKEIVHLLSLSHFDERHLIARIRNCSTMKKDSENRERGNEDKMVMRFGIPNKGKNKTKRDLGLPISHRE